MASVSSRLKQPTVKTLTKVGTIAVGAGVVGISACYTKPFASAIPYYRRQPQKPNDTVDIQTAQRRQRYEQAIVQYYLPRGGCKIDWYQFADIVDWVARCSPSDQDFRQDIWYLFGWRANGQQRSPFAKYLDSNNRGLRADLHNSHYQSEQMHHYLGGTTGNTDAIPSHLLNNPVYALLYELKELVVTGKYNWGDVRLFNIAQKHRDDFLQHGRMTVARNLRNLLVPQPKAFRFSQIG